MWACWCCSVWPVRYGKAILIALAILVPGGLVAWALWPEYKRTPVKERWETLLKSRGIQWR